jgi:ferredoxin--NADP+ reductase
MYKITAKRRITPDVFMFKVLAPDIARKRKAGQFIIYRIDEEGERIPLTIADADADEGTLTLYFQTVGTSTLKLAALEEGDTILDVVGPLGTPTHIEKYGTVVCVGGGIGVAPVYPIAEVMKEAGNKVISIIGARTKELLIMEEEMGAVSDELLVCTDDGSYGEKGFVTDVLQGLIDRGEKIDLVVAIGPVVMMKFVSKVTEPYKIKTMVSLNSIMIDGSGMCGGCRVTIGGETRFVCVDGPEFDGHQVDYDELIQRQSIYLPEEKL